MIKIKSCFRLEIGDGLEEIIVDNMELWGNVACLFIFNKANDRGVGGGETHKLAAVGAMIPFGNLLTIL